MVKYRKKQSKKKGRKTPWYNRKYSAYQIASQALRATRYIKGLVNSEMLHNRIGGNMTIDSTGGVLALSAISQGDTDSGRTGNSIFTRNLFMNLNIKANASNLSTQFVRIILFQDNQQISDTTPTVTDVLDSAYPNAPLNQSAAGRFTVMRNWEFYLNSGTHPGKVLKKYFKLWHHIRYNGSASTDIQRGGLYLLYISDQSVNPPTSGYQIKLGYHDN